MYLLIIFLSSHLHHGIRQKSEKFSSMNEIVKN